MRGRCVGFTPTLALPHRGGGEVIGVDASHIPTLLDGGGLGGYRRKGPRLSAQATCRTGLTLPHPGGESTSTTVVIIERISHAACSGRVSQGVDASAATATTPGCARRRAAPPAPSARAADGVRARSGQLEAPLGLEGCQAARLRGGLRAFFQQLDRDGPGAQDGEQG